MIEDKADKTSDIQEATFDINSIEASQLVSAHQDGNYLVGVTDKGITFRQRLPVDKILNQVGGKWVLEDKRMR